MVVEDHQWLVDTTATQFDKELPEVCLERANPAPRHLTCYGEWFWNVEWVFRPWKAAYELVANGWPEEQAFQSRSGLYVC